MDAVNSTPSIAAIARQEISACKKNGNYAQVLTQSQQLADSFKKTDAEGNQVKSPIATAISVVGVVLSTFLIGKNVGNLGNKLAGKLPADIKQKSVKTISSVVDKVVDKICKMKNQKVADKLFKVVDAGVAYVKKNPAKAVSNLAGVAAVAAIAPDVVKADGNGDGIADIAQHNISAYKSALQGAELLTEIAGSLS